MPRHPGPSGRPYNRARAECFAHYGHTCWNCGHAPGTAWETDHVIQRKYGGSDKDWRNLRPSHGSSCPCPVCGQACNQVRGAGPPPREWTYTSRDW